MTPTLLMEFIDQSENFSHGFECGRIWEILKSGETIIDLPCNEENKKQIEMMCELFGCDYEIAELGEGWIVLNVYKMQIQ